MSESLEPLHSPAVVRQAEAVLAQVQESHLAFACERTLASRLAGVQLPPPIISRLQKQWAYAPGRWPDADSYAAALDDAIAQEADSLGPLRDHLLGGLPSQPPHPRRTLVTGLPYDGSDRPFVSLDPVDCQRLVVNLALCHLLDVPLSESDPDYALAQRLGLSQSLPRWSSIREAYVQITGDSSLSGFVRPDASIVREANEVTTNVLNHALLNTLHKRLVQDFAAQPQEWRKFCVVRAIPDFKPQDRIKLHDFSTLATVAEGAAYPTLPWDDARESYTAAKRGNLVVVTREAIANDDLQAIARIPTKLAVAAATTINEFVFGLFTANPLMGDGTKVFDDGVQNTHANRGTSALSHAALQAALTTMLKQTASSGKRLSLRPRFLLVPAELFYTALSLVQSPLVPGSSNNDANVLKGVVEPICVAQFTDPTDWYLVCDPARVESIEVGFVAGQQVPEFLVQALPAHGQVFTNDQITYKIRWEFGAGWIDHRAAFWSQVAG